MTKVEGKSLTCPSMNARALKRNAKSEGGFGGTVVIGRLGDFDRHRWQGDGFVNSMWTIRSRFGLLHLAEQFSMSATAVQHALYKRTRKYSRGPDTALSSSAVSWPDLAPETCHERPDVLFACPKTN